MPRLLLHGLVIAAIAALAVWLLNVERVTIPPECQTATEALGAGDYDGAIDHYLLCLDAGELPTEALAQVFYGLGVAYSAKDDHYQAIKDYSEAIDLNPNHAWAYNNRCWSYSLLRRADEALADCNEALRLLPDQPEILDSRALAYWLLNEQDKAREDLERARALGSSNPPWEERFQQFEAMF